MSDWASLVGAQDDACLRAFGRNVTYTSQAGVSAVIRGIVDRGVEAEESDRGVYAGLFTKASAFSSPPVRGDEITVDTSVYKIVDLNADEEGGLRMILRFHREAS
jgi:hypothetical protein